MCPVLFFLVLCFCSNMYSMEDISVTCPVVAIVYILLHCIKWSTNATECSDTILRTITFKLCAVNFTASLWIFWMQNCVKIFSVLLLIFDIFPSVFSFDFSMCSGGEAGACCVPSPFCAFAYMSCHLLLYLHQLHWKQQQQQHLPRMSEMRTAIKDYQKDNRYPACGGVTKIQFHTPVRFAGGVNKP